MLGVTRSSRAVYLKVVIRYLLKSLNILFYYIHRFLQSTVWRTSRDQDSRHCKYVMADLDDHAIEKAFVDFVYDEL